MQAVDFRAGHNFGERHDYATAMFSFVFYLPAILLWLATILAGAALGRKTLRVGVRLLFDGKKPAHVAA